MQSFGEVSCNACVTADRYCFSTVALVGDWIEKGAFMTKIAELSNTEFEKELAALARMVTHARQSASDLKIGMPTYCLDMALAAILEEMELHGVDLRKVAAKEATRLAEAFH
jgi:hypothetical protein